MKGYRKILYTNLGNDLIKWRLQIDLPQNNSGNWQSYLLSRIIV